MITQKVAALLLGTMTVLGLTATACKAGPIIVEPHPGSLTILADKTPRLPTEKSKMPTIKYVSGTLIVFCTEAPQGKVTACTSGEMPPEAEVLTIKAPYGSPAWNAEVTRFFATKAQVY